MASAVEAGVAAGARAEAGSRRAIVAAVCVATAAACSTVSIPQEHVDLQASASRSRDDDNVGGQFQTRLTNIGTTDITIDSVALDSPGFDPVAASVREVTLGPGNRIDIPTQYGPVRCDRAPTPASVTVQIGGGVTTSVPLATPYDVLDTISAQECTATEVQRSVEIALNPLPDNGSDSLSAQLTIRRLSTVDAIRLDDIRGSVLYGLTAALPQTMTAEDMSLVVPVTITAATCAAHAIADSKKPFVFPVFLAFGDGDAVYSRIPMPTDTQNALITFQERVCRAAR